MYKTIADTVKFVRELQEMTKDIDRDKTEIFVMPSFTSLKEARENVRQGLLKIGAQNMGWEEQGQFTGEISPIMLKEVGVDIVMVGHSERRHILGESDAEENRKVLCALQHGFRTLLCVGETLEQKNYGVSDEILRIQLKKGLFNVTPECAENLWIAYEPVWAIGVDGTPASREYAESKHAVIKAALNGIFGDAGRQIPVLYGGSVNNDNAKELFEIPDIDGLFVGRSAWDAGNFNKIIRDALN
jgi:triosephosphate isomerase